jgi:hypothetical protein
MNPMKTDNNDFSIIFKEIEKFHVENPSYNENGINEEDLMNDETIRAFSNICREINSDGNEPTICLTFG